MPKNKSHKDGLFGPSFTLSNDGTLSEQWATQFPHATKVLPIVQKLSELHETIRALVKEQGYNEGIWEIQPTADDILLAGLIVADRAYHEAQHLMLIFLANTCIPPEHKAEYFASMPKEAHETFGGLCGYIDIAVTTVIQLNRAIREIDSE